jgi:AcrR family transcriptional regulator
MNGRKAGYHHGDLRHALVSSAVRLIEQAGHEEFSLREAARDVGVSANAAYRHFEDRSALLTAVAQSGLDRLSLRMQRVMHREAHGKDPAGASVARFKATGRAYVEFALDHQELFRVMFGRAGISCIGAAAPDAAVAPLPTPYQLLGEALDSLVANGVLARDRRQGAELLAWTVVHGFAVLALDGSVSFETNRSRSDALSSALDFALVGLCGAA